MANNVEMQEQPIGEHGLNIFYKQFSVVLSETEKKLYRPGEFYLVRKSPKYPLSIAEFQLIWQNKLNHKKFASVKLYFKSKEIGYGEDEVVSADRNVVVECCQFPLWEVPLTDWYEDTGFQQRKFHGPSVGQVNSFFQNNGDIKILSFPQYCRFQTYQKLVRCGLKMSDKVAYARGGLFLGKENVIVLFSRSSFNKVNVEECSPTLNVSVPQFRGRPRKRKNKSPSLKIPGKIPKTFSDGISTEGAQHATYKSAVTSEDLTCKPTGNSEDSTYKPTGKSEDSTYKPTGKSEDSTYKPAVKSEGAKGILARRVQPQDVLIGHCKQNENTNFPSDPIEFKRQLYSFMATRGTPVLKVPIIGYVRVDLYNLFALVDMYGGYKAVTSNKKWRSLYEMLGHCNTITNSATCTRKTYENLLLPFEKHLRSKECESKKELTDDTDSIFMQQKYEKQPEKVTHNNLKSSNSSTPMMTSPSSQSAIKPISRKEFESNLLSRLPPGASPESNLLSRLPPGASPDPLGSAFKLIVEKRRGRPTDQFHEQISQLTSEKDSRKVRNYPSLSRDNERPVWTSNRRAEMTDVMQPQFNSFDQSFNRQHSTADTRRHHVVMAPSRHDDDGRNSLSISPKNINLDNHSRHSTLVNAGHSSFAGFSRPSAFRKTSSIPSGRSIFHPSHAQNLNINSSKFYREPMKTFPCDEYPSKQRFDYSHHSYGVNQSRDQRLLFISPHMYQPAYTNYKLN